jgi:hypothetical protein
MPTSARTSATIFVEAHGDFGGPNDFVDITIEGVNLGILYNSDPTNDLFGNASFSDEGLDIAPSPSTSAVLSLLDLNTILAGEQIDISFDTATVSAPGALGLLTPGLVGLAGGARKRATLA